MPRIYSRQDFTGHKFGKLIITGMIPSKPNTVVKCNYKCDCGTTGIAALADLKRLSPKECKECAIKTTAVHNKTHGFSKTSRNAFKSWESMKMRCNNPKATAYK